MNFPCSCQAGSWSGDGLWDTKGWEARRSKFVRDRIGKQSSRRRVLITVLDINPRVLISQISSTPLLCCSLKFTSWETAGVDDQVTRGYPGEGREGERRGRFHLLQSAITFVKHWTDNKEATHLVCKTSSAFNVWAPGPRSDFYGSIYKCSSTTEVSDQESIIRHSPVGHTQLSAGNRCGRTGLRWWLFVYFYFILITITLNSPTCELLKLSDRWTFQ